MLLAMPSKILAPFQVHAEGRAHSQHHARMKASEGNNIHPGTVSRLEEIMF
jgi:hypothetical protein